VNSRNPAGLAQKNLAAVLIAPLPLASHGGLAARKAAGVPLGEGLFGRLFGGIGWALWIGVLDGVFPAFGGFKKKGMGRPRREPIP